MAFKDTGVQVARLATTESKCDSCKKATADLLVVFPKLDVGQNITLCSECSDRLLRNIQEPRETMQ